MFKNVYKSEVRIEEAYSIISDFNVDLLRDGKDNEKA
jgi:hypothetical protein